ncbi:MAG: hypothetical protein JWN15_3848 [Firmicutes bacterium]|nr:hypothetical protein [Bacillota bacterium]
MAGRGNGGFSFRVRETEVVNAERVAQGMGVWADYLARRLPPARPGVAEPAVKADGPPE